MDEHIKTRDITINKIPARTWNRLRLNETTLTGVSVSGEADIAITGVEASVKTTRSLGDIVTGMGVDMDRLADENGVKLHYIEALDGQTARIEVSPLNENAAYAALEIDVPANASFTVIMNENAPTGATLGVQLRARLGEGARLKLVQSQLMPRGTALLNDIGVNCADKARFELVQLFLGADATYSGCRVTMGGDESEYTAAIGYRGEAGQSFDLNYVADQLGRRTSSDMYVNGVLSDGAAKVFRGTIDFKHGSAGSTGDEKEEVLMLGERAVNRTIPIILCAEEDVQGNHGATIGRLDEETLFYLCSRGLSAAEAEKLIANARIGAVIGRIGDAEAQRQARAFIGEDDNDEA